MFDHYVVNSTFQDEIVLKLNYQQEFIYGQSI